ncbi:MAG: 2-oxoacid:acceptor oxidoreductase family protein [bacterium]
MTTKILLSGDGGQGIQTIADIITRSAHEKGLYVSDIPNFGLEQRGGVSLAFLQISNEEILYPKFTKPDILLIMSEQADFRTKIYQKNANKIIKLEDYNQVLENEKIQFQSYNIFFLGIMAKVLHEMDILEAQCLRHILGVKLASKLGWEENQKAFNCGVLKF